MPDMTCLWLVLKANNGTMVLYQINSPTEHINGTNANIKKQNYDETKTILL
jgi:hypothetical protein